MGSLLGHILAGNIYLFMGIRWTYCLLIRYYLCRKQKSFSPKNAKTFKSSLCYPMGCLPHVPLEAIFIFSSITFQILGEFATAFLDDFNFVMNGQHMSMMIIIDFAMLIIILQQYKIVTMPNVEYALMSTACVTMALTMWFHVKAKSAMEGQIHLFILMTGLLLAVLFIAEAKYRSNVLVSLAKDICLSIIGTWLMVGGLILFPPNGHMWDQQDVMQMKVVLIIFLWVIVGNIVSAFVMGIMASAKVHSMSPVQVSKALDISYSGFSYREEAEEGYSMLSTSDQYEI